MNNKRVKQERLLAGPKTNNVVINMNDDFKAAIENSARKRLTAKSRLVRIILSEWLLEHDPESIPE